MGLLCGCCSSDKTKSKPLKRTASSTPTGRTVDAVNDQPKKVDKDKPAVIRKVTSASEFKEVLDSAGEKNVVIDFYATWCGPCKIVAPLYQELAQKHAENCVAVKIDVDELEEVAAKCGVSAMPTFQVYRAGNKVGEVVGAPGREKLEGLFTKQ